MNEPAFILVLSNGREMAALPVVRSLGRHGFRTILASVIADNIAADSRYTEKVEITPDPTRHVDHWLNWLEQFLEQNKVAAVFPVSDNMVVPLFLNRQRFAGQRLMLIGTAEYELAYNKANTFRTARELNLPIPQTEIMTTLEQTSEITSRFSGFPLIMKPASSRALINNRVYDLSVRRVHSRQEFHEWAQKLLPYGPLLIQNLLYGHGIGQEFLLREGEVLAEFQHERVHEPLEGGGGSYRRSMKMNPTLREYSLRLLRSANWSGIAMVEYLLTPAKQFYLMEINGRLWGSLPLAVAAGIDFPRLWFQQMRGQIERARSGYPVPVYCRNLERDIKWQKTNWRADHADPRLKTVPRTRQFVEWFRIVTGREHYDEFARDDTAPGFLLIRKWFRKAGRKLTLKLWQLPGFNQIYLTRAASRMRNARRIVALCKGNTCRSPFLGEVLRLKAARQKIKLPPLVTRGILQRDGSPSSEMARSSAREFDVDLNSHLSQSFYKDIRQVDDVFLLVDPHHAEEVFAHYRPLKPKIVYVGLLDPQNRNPLVMDPDLTDTATYHFVYSRLQRAADRLLNRLS